MTAAIHGKMCAILKEVGVIGKNSTNASQNFKYRGIDDVYNALNPIMAKHGVYMTAAIIEKSRDERTNAKGTVLAFTTLRMRYTFHAEDGSSISTEAEGEGMDSGDKSSNKAMAIAHKYALLQAFCVPTKELDDPDAETHEIASGEKISAAQRDELIALINSKGRSIEALCGYYKIEALPDLPASKFKEAVAILNRPSPAKAGQQHKEATE